MVINIKCSAGDEEVSRSIWTSFVLSLSFTFVFTAYISIQNLQSSLNQEEGLGVISLSCLYASIIVSAILAPTVIKVIGTKLAIIIPWILHVIYTGANFYPTFSTLIPSSVLLGLVSGSLWTSQCIYIATNGAAMSKASGEDLHAVLSKLNGMFFTMYETTQITGNLISSLVLNHGSYDDVGNTTKVCGSQDCPLAENATKIIEPERDIVYTLLGIYLAFDVFGLLLTALFLPPLPKSEWSQKQTACDSITSCFFALLDYKLLMLIPLIGFMAMEQAVIWTDFTKSFISCSFGIQKVGFVMAAYGGSTSVSNLIWSRVANFTGRYFLFVTASLINMGIFIALYTWTPDQEYYLFIIAVIWGISEGIWQTQSNCFSALFEEKSANIIIKAVDILQSEQESGNPFIPHFPDFYYSKGYFENMMEYFQAKIDIDNLKSNEACAFVILEDEITQKFVDFLIDNKLPSYTMPSLRSQVITRYVKDEITVITEHKDIHKEAIKLFNKKEETKVGKPGRKNKGKANGFVRRLTRWLLQCVAKQI